MTTTDPAPDDAWRLAPDGLSTSATDLWDGVVEEWLSDDLEPEPAERALLVEAVHTLSSIDEMSATVAADGLMVPGPGGRPTVHPLLARVDTSRRTLALILKQIGQADRQTSSALNGLRAHGRG